MSIRWPIPARIAPVVSELLKDNPFKLQDEITAGWSRWPASTIFRRPPDKVILGGRAGQWHLKRLSRERISPRT